MLSRKTILLGLICLFKLLLFQESPLPEEVSVVKDKNDDRKWKELSPRSNYDDFHSSSEMMLVLLPNKDKSERGKFHVLINLIFDDKICFIFNFSPKSLIHIRSVLFYSRYKKHIGGRRL